MALLFLMFPLERHTIHHNEYFPFLLSTVVNNKIAIQNQIVLNQQQDELVEQYDVVVHDVPLVGIFMRTYLETTDPTYCYRKDFFNLDFFRNPSNQCFGSVSF